MRQATTKAVYFVLGILSLVMAGAGAALPLIPATPFILLAAACFAKSSPSFHRYLLNHRYTGPIVRDWEESRCIRQQYKFFAIGSMIVFGSISVIFIVKPIWLKLAGIALMAIGSWYITGIKTCVQCQQLEPSDGTE